MTDDLTRLTPGETFKHPITGQSVTFVGLTTHRDRPKLRAHFKAHGTKGWVAIEKEKK